jgi:hypothetical protein
MSTKKHEHEHTTEPQKPAFDPGKTYPPKPHPQHPHESDPPEYDGDGEHPDAGGTNPPGGPGQPGKP